MAELVIFAPAIEERPKPFALRASPEWWEAAALVPAEPPTRLLEAPGLELEGYRIGRRLLFRGRLVGRFELVCGRCTEPFTLALDEPLELLLEPAPESEEGWHGIRLDLEDLSLGHYAGDELDFAPVLVESLLTSWPMQPRCAESCRGLCPSCGRNLNTEACACDTSRGNRPFEALGALLRAPKPASQVATEPTEPAVERASGRRGRGEGGGSGDDGSR